MLVEQIVDEIRVGKTNPEDLALVLHDTGSVKRGFWN
jgi:hypothetical protein